MLRNYLLPALIAAMAMLIGSALDLAQLLGAHPFWSHSIIMIGLLPGMILGLIIMRLPMNGLSQGLLATALLLLAYWLAGYGKTRFAASYAEDALAGKLWYFGWIATAASTTALLSVLAFTIVGKKTQS